MSNENATRRCFQCGETKAIALFAKDHRHPLGHSYLCRACDKIRKREYSQRPEVKERLAIQARQRYLENQERAKARRAEFRKKHGQSKTRDPVKESARRQFSQAVRSGKITRPHSCEMCGASGQIHGHHEDYSKPFDVRWLCRKCHGIVHRKYQDAAS